MGQSILAVQVAFDAGIRYFDTAPLYGHGLSERRLGVALGTYPRLRWQPRRFRDHWTTISARPTGAAPT